MKVLFVTWDGPQLSYLESLFVPIFSQLKFLGLEFYVLQFTWGSHQGILSSKLVCEQAGIFYRAVTVFRKPQAIGALISAISGARLVKKMIRTYGIDIVMPRSNLPALSTLLALRNVKCSLVFDADGLPLDERVEFAGQSPFSLVQQILRVLEAQAIRRSSVVLTRSKKAIEILHSRAGAGTEIEKFYVVTNGRDTDRYQPADAGARKQVRASLGLGTNTPLLIYAGSIGPQYCLNEMLILFAKVHAHLPQAHLLILTSLPEAVWQVLETFPLHSCVTTLSVTANDVAKYLSCADLGLALRQPSFSMQAVSPIKLGEYLLCGLPVVATAGIGDTDQVVSDDVGFIIENVADNSQLEASAKWFVDVVLPARDLFRTNCRAAGITNFSLGKSVESYRRAFSYLLDRRPEKGTSY